MMKKIINYLKSLNMDITPWMDNHYHSVKEKAYNGRKIIIMIEKNKTDNYVGKFMIMNYEKELVLGEDEITWQYSPVFVYKTEPLQHNIQKTNSIEEMKQKMENLFQEAFIEKKIKLKFTK